MINEKRPNKCKEEYLRGIEKPKWNPDKDLYEFRSGITADAKGGVIGLAPDGRSIRCVTKDGWHDIDWLFQPNWKSISDRAEREEMPDGEAGFTDAEKIAVADMMIERWKQFRLETIS